MRDFRINCWTANDKEPALYRVHTRVLKCFGDAAVDKRCHSANKSPLKCSRLTSQGSQIICTYTKLQQRLRPVQARHNSKKLCVCEIESHRSLIGKPQAETNSKPQDSKRIPSANEYKSNPNQIPSGAQAQKLGQTQASPRFWIWPQNERPQPPDGKIY